MRLTTDSLELVSLVVFRDKAQEMTSYLLHSGFFHPVDIRDVENELSSLSQVQIAREFDRFAGLQAKTAALARQIGVRLEPVRNVQGMTVADSEAVLKRIEGELTGRLVKREELRGTVKADEDMLSHISQFLPFPIPQEKIYSLLFMSVGTIEQKNIPVLEHSLAAPAEPGRLPAGAPVPYVLYPFSQQKTEVHALFLGLRRDRETIRRILSDVGWKEEDLKGRSPVPEEMQERMRVRIRETRGQIGLLDAEIAEFKAGNREELSRIYSFSSLNKSLAEAKRYAVTTDKTVIFSGWIPAEDKARFFSEVSAVAGTPYVEAKPPEETGVAKEDIPVRFGRNPLLKPFSILVESYGVPRYGSIDPTLFVAISFVFMFGLMFGDLGQGLVLALIGVFFLLKGANPAVRQFAALLLYCGSSSAVFGFLYGSAFGFEFPSVWAKPMEDVMGILRFSLYGGICLISAGIVINIINSLRDRNYLRAFFDKAGLVAGIVYWSAIAVVSRAMFAHASVSGVLYLLIAAGLGFLFLFPMVEFLMHRHKGATFFESFMESLLGLLEFGMGYLANTVSFVRMGAFALAHAALFLAVFQISRMFQSGVVSAGVIIFGNIGIMVLEGVVVSIQSLRLNYYEFFSKFFASGKSVFKPLSVRYN